MPKVLPRPLSPGEQSELKRLANFAALQRQNNPQYGKKPNVNTMALKPSRYMIDAAQRSSDNV